MFQSFSSGELVQSKNPQAGRALDICANRNASIKLLGCTYCHTEPIGTSASFAIDAKSHVEVIGLHLVAVDY
jgi:hypothetical protein